MTLRRTKGRASCLAMAAAVTMTAAHAHAQSGAVDSSVRENALKLVTREQVLPTLRDGAGTSMQASVEPKFVLVGSTTGGVTGKARIGWIPRNNVLIDGIVSGPISSGEAQFATLDGLGNNVSLQLRAQYAWKNTRTTANTARTESLSRSVTLRGCNATDALEQVMCVAADRAAEALLASRGVASRITEEVPQERAAAVGSRVRDVRAAMLANESERLQVAVEERAPIIGLESRASGDVAFTREELQRAFGREWRRSLRNGEVETTTSLLVSGSVLTANQAFSFLDAATLASQRLNRTGRSGEVGVGLAKTRGAEPLMYVGGGYEWGTSYQGRPKSEVCQPFVAGSLRCQSVSVGGPSESTVKRLHVEGRGWLLAAKVALSARYLRDLDADTDNIEFPVYFLRDVKNIEDNPTDDVTPAFTGGVSAGWQGRAAEREFFVYFFVGTVLGIPGL